jgi:hypothetical protein
MSLRQALLLSALCMLLATYIPMASAQAASDQTSGNQPPAAQAQSTDSQLQLTHKEAHCGDFAGARPPKYHIFTESRAKRDDGSEAVEIKLSLHRNDFTETKIESVSCELQHKYRHESYVDAWMVDDERAATHARGWDKNDPTVQHEFRVHLIVAKKKESTTASFNWFPDRDDRQHATDVTLQ